MNFCPNCGAWMTLNTHEDRYECTACLTCAHVVEGDEDDDCAWGIWQRQYTCAERPHAWGRVHGGEPYLPKKHCARCDVWYVDHLHRCSVILAPQPLLWTPR